MSPSLKEIKKYQSTNERCLVCLKNSQFLERKATLCVSVCDVCLNMTNIPYILTEAIIRQGNVHIT
jgi:hypothetical protein